MSTGAGDNAQQIKAIKNDGTLWTWGRNTAGALGLNQTHNQYDRSSPTQVPGTNWAYVTGRYSVYATKTDGTLWAWAYNNKGQLGDNTVVYRSSPTQIPGTTWAQGRYKFTQGGSNVSAIKTDGTLWVWGYGYNGAHGTNAVTNYSSPVQVGSDTTWAAVSSYLYGKYSNQN